MLEQNRVMEDAAGETADGQDEAATAVPERDSPETVVAVANSALTAAQALALAALANGASLNEAAKAAGVERNALYRWRTRNQHFMAAMNAWRREHLEHARDQFLLMRDSAMEAVRLGLAKGDVRLGIAVLDRMGGSAVAETSPTVPGMIKSPEIEHPEAEMLWERMEQNFGRLPIEAQRIIPRLVQLAGRIANTWGMELLEKLAEEYRARALSPEQAERVPWIILTALDAEALLLEHRPASEGGASGP